MSVDPYMRELMDQAGLPDGVSWWDLDAPLEGRTIGRVLTSADPSLSPGDLVLHRKGWRTHGLVEASTVRVLPRHAGVPLTAYLSVLGGTGLTAYVALTRTLRLQPGEDLFVSAAAGGVGTAVGQFARLVGAGRIVGSAGSPLKVERLVKDLGFDAAFDYHDGPVSDLLTSAAPDGLDTAVENVGGDHLEAAIGSLRDFGRIAWVGAVAQYHSSTHPRPPRATSSTWSESPCAWKACWSATTRTPSRSWRTSRSRIYAPEHWCRRKRWSTVSRTSPPPSWGRCGATTWGR
ncbi:hypothetical protein SHKM778_46370 [Streptomyces sp. KM77-8]|uniref:NADP-dependent oxidoreductase n=1 Tax=Streptomyces haneummycinicus TaxID=3074435 RepID=A0AAT9HLR1_9ACTN